MRGGECETQLSSYGPFPRRGRQGCDNKRMQPTAKTPRLTPNVSHAEFIVEEE